MSKEVLISSGDAVTAKLVEQSGFDGIWVSGFEVSTRLGLPDNGSVTMTEMLNVCKPIVDAVKIPVWVDCDTGYGNLKRTVIEFEKIGVTGICVEDNLPNKQNSLWGDKIPLMSKEEFGDKLNSIGAWDERKIKIMARTEALVRGYGYQDATERLLHYRDCGADMLMPHTRSSETLLVVDGTPCAIVPTLFPSVTNKELFDRGYDMVIWANQTERVKIKAIRDMLDIMKHYDSAEFVHKNLSATLDEMKGLANG